MLELSTAARCQSILSAAFSSASRIACSLSHTPARCHSPIRRQQVIPLPQPISGGRSCQAMPVLSTNRMPVRHLRSSIRGRPPRRLGGFLGISGSIRSHNASETIGWAMALSSLTKTRSLERFNHRHGSAGVKVLLEPLK